MCPLYTLVAIWSHYSPRLLPAVGAFRFLAFLLIFYLLSTCCVHGLPCSFLVWFFFLVGFPFFKNTFLCDSLHNFPVKAWRDFLDCFVFFLNCGTLFTWLLALYFSTASRLLLGFFHFGQLLLWIFCLSICSFLTSYLIFTQLLFLKFSTVVTITETLTEAGPVYRSRSYPK